MVTWITPNDLGDPVTQNTVTGDVKVTMTGNSWELSSDQWISSLVRALRDDAY